MYAHIHACMSVGFEGRCAFMMNYSPNNATIHAGLKRQMQILAMDVLALAV